MIEIDAHSHLLKRIQELEIENERLKLQQIDTAQAKELYLKIFEEFPALIWRSRTDKLCDYFNKTWLDFTGRTYEQEFGNGWTESVHPDDFSFCLDTYVNSFDKHEAFVMEYRMKNKYGEYRWIRDFGRPFYDIDNSFLGYIGSCYDITDRKENELKLEELNQTKDKFFSIIAHDLKSPFNTLLGYSDLLIRALEDNNTEKTRNYASNIQILAQSTFKLVENLLKWSQIQKGQLKPLIEKNNLNILVSDLIVFFDEIAKRKNIEIVNAVNENIDILCDTNMMQTILRNLFSNAIKYTNSDGTVVVEVSTCDNIAQIRIKDNGVGIPSEKLPKLFKIEKNVSTIGTANELGTGLGLILCKELIALQGGCIKAESVLGVGSVFTLTIKMAKK